MPTNRTVAAPAASPEDRRCVVCGDDRATDYLRVTDTSSHWICLDSFACEQRQAAEAEWAEQRWTITAAGRAALACIEQAEQLSLGVAS